MAKRVRKSYKHSAYWYATRYGWTVSTATTYTEKYFEDVYHGFAGNFTYGGHLCADPGMVCVYMAADLVAAIGRQIKEKVVDPIRRGELQNHLRRDYLRFRRPVYYARETARRHALLDERRKIRRRATTASRPTPEEIRAAWEARRTSKTARIRLGGMLHDLECYVDNRLRIDANGNIVGRNRGIKGWIKDNLHDLLPHYKALMYYKELAMKLRQATGIHDPTPTSELLPAEECRFLSAKKTSPHGCLRTNESFSPISENDELWGGMSEKEKRNLAAFRNTAKSEGGGRMHAVMQEIFEDPRGTAAAILEVLDRHLSPMKIADGEGVRIQIRTPAKVLPMSKSKDTRRLTKEGDFKNTGCLSK